MASYEDGYVEVNGEKTRMREDVIFKCVMEVQESVYACLDILEEKDMMHGSEEDIIQEIWNMAF